MLLARPRSFEFDVLELDAEVFADELGAGEDGDVFAHGLAAVTEARGLDGDDVERAAQLVDHEGGQRFAFDVFGDDEHRLADLGDLFEQREHVLEAADLLFEDEDVSVLQLGFHRLGVGDEIGREIALVELHAFDHFEGGLDGLGFLDRDGAVLADLVHRVGDDLADGGVPVGGDGGDLLDFLFVLHLLGDLVEVRDGGLNGLADAALNADGVAAGGHELQAFAINRLGQHGRGGGAVARGVAGLAGDFAHHLGAHVFIRILQLDFLGDGDAVLGHGGGAEFLVEHDVAAFGAERGGDGAGELGHPAQHGLPCGFIEE